jgi:hypothetical protein
MIVFQSSVVAKNANHRSCHSPSPGGDLSRLGSGERNLAEPKVAQQPSERARQSAEALAKVEASQRRDKGELNCSSGREPALIKVGEHGTRPYSRAVPFGHSVILSKALGLCVFAPLREESVFISVHPWLKTNFCNPAFKVPQAHSRLFKAIKSYSSVLQKKGLFFMFTDPTHYDLFRPIPANSGQFRPIPANSGQFRPTPDSPPPHLT